MTSCVKAGAGDLKGTSRAAAPSKESLKVVLAQAQAAQDKKKFVLGAALFTKACEMDAKSITAWFGRGCCLDVLPDKNLEEVEQCWRRALEIEPKNVQVHNDLAGLLEGKGDVDGAENHYRLALEIDPGCKEVHVNSPTCSTARVTGTV